MKPQTTIVRAAEIPAGLVFISDGRVYTVVRVHGTDARAPVIVVQHDGQYALWALDGVRRAIDAQRRA